VDPLTWPLWLKLIAGWGPLGVWAGRAEVQRGRVERAHHASRDAHTAEIARINAEHERQLAELTNRFVAMIEKQSAHALKLTSRVRGQKEE
jgi:hypothetical protein